MAEEKQRELRVVMFPWLAQGHITPFLELAKRLATHGLKIFFVSTPLNIKLRIRPQVLNTPGIDLVELAMPSVEGLPRGLEFSADVVKRADAPVILPLLSVAMDLLEKPFEALLQQLSPDFVIYDYILNHQQFSAIAMGLQESNVSFLWILPAGHDLLQGFQDQIGEKGLVVAKWAPQLHILNHPSIAAFLTHCGWNSMTEGLRFGVPLITLPMQFEQGLCARLACELNVGVEVTRNNEDGSFTKEDINKAIRVIMKEEEGAQIKCSVAKISDMLTNNNFEVSERNVRDFVSMLRTSNKQLG
ncbi:hypothetical protein SUGI_0390420 [Cryptomeria japonica]|nr:hypothetical protein SUGI_0390420 [Cryptomeria japonica]